MPTREERKLATKQRIYSAAEKLFLDQGFDDTSVASVTQKAKVAKGTFFVHFPSKVELLTAMGEEQLERALDAIEGADRRDTWPFSRQIDHVFRTLARTVDASPDLMRLVVVQRAFDVGPTDGSSHERLSGLLVELIKSGKRSNDLRADVLADRMSAYLMGVWKTALEQWAGRGGNFERWLMESVRLAFDGLAPR